jgi:nitroreductase
LEFYEAVRKRRTVREFDSRPVEEEKLKRVLEAGLRAPANAHLKEWEYILLRDPENRRKALADALKARDLKDKKGVEELIKTMPYEALKEVYRKSLPLQLTMMLEAPELLIVCYKMRKPLAQVKNLFELNNLASVWCAVENIVLAMAAEGLYGCTYSPYSTVDLKKYLGVPSDMEVAVIIPIGYPKTQPEERKAGDLEKRLHIDKW